MLNKNLPIEHIMVYIKFIILVVDDTMKEMINQPNIKNHLMKNDLNTFFDSYLKHKNTLRGAVK